MKTIRDITIILAALAFVFIYWRHGSTQEITYLPADTVIRIDTIRDTIPKLVHVHHYRTDTVTLKVAGDTVYVAVEVPIERKTYATDDYKAIIEGFRPQLISMEIYPKTTIITNTEVRTVTKRPRWGIGVQAGYGFAGQKAVPYIGVGLQYNLITF